MRTSELVFLLAGFLAMSEQGVPQVAHSESSLRAPTYYLAAQVVSCEREKIRVSGASNLPHKAKVSVTVTDFRHAGWQDNSDEVVVEIDDMGFFQTEIHPKANAKFHRNSLLRAIYAPYRPKQPTEVLKITGRKGENLGGLKNPQVFQGSGWIYGLETLARVTNCGEGIEKATARRK